MASVTLPRHLRSDSRDIGAAKSFLFFTLDSDGSLRFDATKDVAEDMHRAVGGLFLEEGLPLDSDEVLSFNTRVTEAFLSKHATLPAGVSVELSAGSYSSDVQALKVSLGWAEGRWTQKEYSKALKAGATLFSALRHTCTKVDYSTGKPKPPGGLTLRKGYEFKDGAIRRVDDRMGLSNINAARVRLNDSFLSVFTGNQNQIAVARDSCRPVSEVKALIDAVHRCNPGRLCDTYRYWDVSRLIKLLSLKDADKILRKEEHRQARKDLLEILLYMRKKVPVSKRTRQIQQDDG